MTILEINQIFGENALDVIKKYGTKAVITDFAILLGGYSTNNYHLNGHNSLDKRTGYYWTKNDDGNNDVRVINSSGNNDYIIANLRYGACRPVLPLPLVQSVKGKTKEEIPKIEYGHYPRKAVPHTLQDILEREYILNKLTITGNKYTIDSKKCDQYNEEFSPINLVEYEYEGQKYVRVKANPSHNVCILSNGSKYEYGQYVWIEVEPVKWLVDEKSNIMITEELIIAGIQFLNEKNYKGDFSSSDMKKFIDKHLSKDLFQHQEKIEINTLTVISDNIIETLYSKGYAKEQIITIALDILNQILKPNKTDVKQKLKTLNK